MSSVPLFIAAVVVTLLATTPGSAQQHRATRLGNPATRFAPPLQQPEDLRQTLRSPKLKDDVLHIARESGYQGDWEDLQKAAAEAPIKPLRVPPGTRLPAMSTREKGKAVLLRDVLWAGKEPFDAYEFTFESKGRRYRLVCPKLCSNFWIEDQGIVAPPPKPALQLTRTAPVEIGLCDAAEIVMTVRNTGNVPLHQLRLVDNLPAGWLTVEQKPTQGVDVGTLAPGEAKAYKFWARGKGPGKFEGRTEATCTEIARTAATAATTLRAPVLALECHTPAQVVGRHPTEICLDIRNTGDAPAANVTVSLPVPVGARFESGTEGVVASGGRVAWSFRSLAPGASNRVCAVFTAAQSAALDFVATANAVCCAPVESRCVSTVKGVAGVLFEVIDLADPIQVGEDQTYEITVVSQGNAPLTNIKVVCNLPEAQEFVSGDGASAVAAEGRKITMAPIATLGAKERARWRVVVKTLKAGDVRFETVLSCDQYREPLVENESTSQY